LKPTPFAARGEPSSAGVEVWLEAAVMAGILACTQAIPRQDRRKFLNDTLLFLQAADAGAVVVCRNSRDLDLLLKLKP
jgi:hypothetical protein